jgi:two-component system, chemotaxis family, chemotaxis protein CheY
VDGDEAVLAYRRELERGEPYDLVCMDIHMPKMNGIEALNLIRREERLDPMLRSRHTKIVMTTGSDERSSIDQAFQTLCDAYMVKPIDIKEFRDVLECLFPIQSRD